MLDPRGHCFVLLRQWNKESPSGKYRAVVRKLKDKKGEEKQFLEVSSATVLTGLIFADFVCFYSYVIGSRTT